ncbi:MAG: YXWGXW repeat-containing protein [Phycisphaerae bacterium]
MRVHHIYKLCIVTTLFVIGMGLGLAKAVVVQLGQADVEDGVQVLTRGPVHEAFAEIVTFNPEPGIVVSKAPPDAIAEMPAEQRPGGDNVAWIPGYWAWDDEAIDFLWVSGTWRDLPPDRQWMPGYWIRSGQGYQWTSGYWADATVSEIEYLPKPPATIEAGPNTAAFSTGQSWIPGCWVWHQGRYAWRPGYWETVRPNWDWIPAHYVWAPRGYVFVEGYYDYSVDRRGVLFAPVHFGAGVYRRRGFSYSPTVVIDLAAFTDHLFVRPRYQHYYFGDYYAASYRDAGFYPSFSYYSSHKGYDPIYAHQRWENRQDRSWEPRVQAEFKSRRDHEESRPPRTWADQSKLITSGKSGGNRRVIATALSQLTQRKDRPLRLQPLDKKERQVSVQRVQEVQKFRQNRQTLENRVPVKAVEKPSREFAPTKVRLPRSPIVGKSADQFGKGQAPPKRPQTLQPDFKVKPKVTKVERAPEQPRAKQKEKSKGETKDKHNGESGKKSRD